MEAVMKIWHMLVMTNIQSNRTVDSNNQCTIIKEEATSPKAHQVLMPTVREIPTVAKDNK